MKNQLIGTLIAVLAVVTACGSDEASGAGGAATAESTPASSEVSTDEPSESEEPAAPEEDAGVDDAGAATDTTPAAPMPFESNPAGLYDFEFGGGQLVVEAPAEFFFADLGKAVLLDDPTNPGGASDYYGFIQLATLPTDTGSAEGTDPETWFAETSTVSVEERDVSDPRWQIYRLTTSATIDLVDQVQLKPGELYELWFITVDSPDALILMGKTAPSTPETLDVLPEVADSVLFEPGDAAVPGGDADPCVDRPWECGDPSVAPAGVPVCVPAMASLGFEMNQERMVIQPNPWWLLIEAPGVWEGEQNPALVVIKPSRTVDGAPITSAQQVFELQNAAMEMTPIESRTFFGSEVDGYAFVGEAVEPELFSVVTPAEEEELGITLEQGFISPPPFGEVWFVDTDDGPVLVSSAAWLEDELPAAQAILDEVGPSLELQPSSCG